MLKNYFKIAIRNLLKYKIYSFINIAGLATGVACCILILLFVEDELSYDRWNEKADRIVRIGVDAKLGDQSFYGAVTSPPLAAALKNEFPEVEETVRLRSFGFPVLRYEDKVFSEERFFWADSSIFKVFTFKFIAGDPAAALVRPGSVVITRSMAEKYFGNEDPIGKSLNADNRRDYDITGVIEDMPVNSHFHFDFIASLSSYPAMDNNSFWLNNNLYTYVLLKEGTDKELFEQKIQSLVGKYIGPSIEMFLGIVFNQEAENAAKYNFIVQPLTDIYLKSDLDYDIEANSDILYVYMFSIIAVSILFIACINFMNLTTARSSNRAKEVGIRKTLGSSQPQLVRQFLVETILMSGVAIFFSVVIVEALLPLFNDLTGKQIHTGYFSDIVSIPMLIILAVIVGTIAGIYPAFYLSSFRPAVVLKGKIKQGSKTPWLRSGLVIAQFTISVILIIGTIIVYNQMEYIQNKKLGFNKDQIIIIKKSDDLNKMIHPFRQELLSNSDIINVSNTLDLMGEPFNNSVHRIIREGLIENHIINNILTDYDFVDTYQLKIKEGRYFSREVLTDSMAVVINEAAVKAFSLNDPIGKFILEPGDSTNFYNLKIIGVVEDFHYESLHNPIKPLLLKLKHEDIYGKYLSVKINSANISSTLSYLAGVWKKYANNQAFEYTFYDNEFARIYAAERRTKDLVTIFSILSIFIACLGLFGLSAFTTEQRTKEIGIRKVLGASVGGILILLSKEFSKWVLIAIIIASPAAYFIMNSWLENFAYRVEIELWTILLAGLAAIAIALLTVSFQAVRAAFTNPVKALKYE